MKKFVILPLSVGLTMALSLVVGAYQQEDILYTKTKLLGINTLECDVNADGSTDILDLLQIKHDMFKDLIVWILLLIKYMYLMCKNLKML